MAEGMTVKDFVANTLTQIVEGVEEAQRSVGDRARFAPGELKYDSQSLPDMKAKKSRKSHELPAVEPVEFDLQITGESTTEKNAEGGFQVKVVSFLVGGKSGQRQESVNRVRFQVPIEFGSQASSPERK